MAQGDFYSPGEVSKALGLPEATILALLTSGQLEGYQDKWARWRIPTRVVDKAIQDRQQQQELEKPIDPAADTVAMPAVTPTNSADISDEDTTQGNADAEDNHRGTVSTDNHGQSVGESGWTSTDTAAKALGVSPRTVRRFIDRGELQGRKVKEGIVEAWEVSINSLYQLRDKRISEGQVRRDVRVKTTGSDSAMDMADMLRDITAELVRSSSEAAEFRTRLELTERAESSL
jgi:predicted site-specific integrase-resolvase